jgi:hypothetical protein
MWRVFPNVNTLIGAVRAGLSRRLSQTQRNAFRFNFRSPRVLTPLGGP